MPGGLNDAKDAWFSPLAVFADERIQGNATGTTAPTNARTNTAFGNRRRGLTAEQRQFNLNRNALVGQRIDVEFWDDHEELWDTVVLKGITVPGICSISGSGPKLKIDAKSAAGSDGARIVSKGFDLAKIKIEVKLWTEDHLNRFSELLAQIHPLTNPTARDGISIEHPALQLLLIDKVLIEEIGFLVPGHVQGMRSCSISCIQYRPPAAATASRRSATHSATAARNTLNTNNALGGQTQSPATATLNGRAIPSNGVLRDSSNPATPQSAYERLQTLDSQNFYTPSNSNTQP